MVFYKIQYNFTGGAMKKIIILCIGLAVLLPVMGCKKNPYEGMKLSAFRAGEGSVYADVLTTAGNKEILSIGITDMIDSKSTWNYTRYAEKEAKVDNYRAVISENEVRILVNDRFEVMASTFGDPPAQYKNVVYLTRCVKAFDLAGIGKLGGGKQRGEDLEKYFPKF
jgi:hypothetical protein